MWNRISRMATSATALGLVAILTGCNSSGLSPREVHGQDYATYVFAMPAPASAERGEIGLAPSPTTQPLGAGPILAAPIKIAVAQVGELAPPSAMLKTLRGAPGAFSDVQGIPDIIETPMYEPPRIIQGGPAAQASAARAAREAALQDAHDRANRLRQFAHDVGAQYLFLYGGTVDRSATSTPLSLANLTIVGMFVVPSEKIEARATAAGSLIDVETGRVVLVASADAQRQTLSPSAAKDGDEIKLLSSLRDDVTTALADHLIKQMKNRASDKASHPAMGG